MRRCSKRKDVTDTFIHTDQLWERAKALAIDLDGFVESLHTLERAYFIRGRKSYTGEGWQFPIFRVTTDGFEEYAKTEIADYSEIVRAVLSRIINDDERDNVSIARAINQPLVIVNHILDTVVQTGRMKVMKPMNTDGIYTIFNVSPDLKRLLRDY